MDEFNLLISLLEHESYRNYNILLAKKISINAAILYTNLTYLNRLFKDKQDENGYFYTTSDLIYENTALTYDMARTAAQKLKEIGLIDIVKRGMPSKNYYKIIQDVQLLKNLLTESGNPQTKDTVSSNHGYGNTCSNNIINNKTNITNNNSLLHNEGVNPKPTSNTLFDIPSIAPIQTEAEAKKPKNIAISRINIARSSNDWSALTFRDFAYLFQMKYEEHYKLQCLDFDIYAAGTIKKFMESYNIQKNHMDKVLDTMFENYEHSKLKNEKFFTLSLNSIKQDFIVNELLLGYNGKSDALDRYERTSKERIAQYEEEAKKQGITTATKSGEVF